MSVPRFDHDAERAVVGAVLSAGAVGPETGWAVVDRARAVGLTAAAFYTRSLAALWSELEQLRDEGVALDAVTASSEIECRAEGRVGPISEFLGFDAVWLRGRLHELACEVSGFSNVEHHARVVIREAERRAREAA